ALGPVHLEDRMREDLRGTDESLGKPEIRILLVIGEVRAAEGAPDGLNRFRKRALVERDADAIVTDLAQVDAVLDRLLHDLALIGTDLDRDSVEEGVGADLEAERRETIGEAHGVAMNALCDRLEAARPVEDGIHRRDDGKKNLCR